MFSASPRIARVLQTMVVSCVLLSACTLDRAPLAGAALDSDGGDTGALVQAPDSDLIDLDATIVADARTADSDLTDSAVSDSATGDATNIDSDAGDAAVVAVDSGVVIVGVDAQTPPPRYEGSCELGCQEDESCVQTNGLTAKHSYCAQRCQSDTDCAAGPTGASAPRCSSQGYCRLPCDAVLGKGCPTGMVCIDALVILPGGDGSCAFRQ